MQLSIYIEGSAHEAAATKLLDELPSATKVEKEQNERGLISLATVIALFTAVGAGAKMVKDIADAGKSIADLAKFLVDWKQQDAAKEKTILLAEKPDGESRKLELTEVTPVQEVEEFLESA